MPDFLVKKREEWIQPVVVKDAHDIAEALQRAHRGDYEVHDDPQYNKDIGTVVWDAERIEE